MRAVDHPLFMTLQGMKWRCYNKRRDDYQRYGALGVRVCDRWLNDFWSFVQDMGDKPSPRHTIDRIDPAGNYEPGNCRWATHSEQAFNRRLGKRAAKHYDLNGKSQPLSAWASECGINKWVIRARVVSLGWTLEQAISTPVRPKRATV
jgi:hypothetical protein